MPRDVLSAIQQGHKNQRDWTKEEWAALYKYTARIRTMCETKLLECPGYHYRPEIYQCLAPRKTDVPGLFPELRGLTWTLCIRTQVPFMHQLLTERLVVLELKIPKTTPTILALLRSLGNLCPNLESLRILCRVDIPQLGQETAEAISESVCQWTHLTSVYLPGVTPQILQHLANIPSLSSLGLSLSLPPDNDFPAAGTSTYHFERLRELYLTAPDLTTASNLLEDLRTPARKLTVSVNESPGTEVTSTSLIDLLGTASHSLDCASLSELRVGYTELQLTQLPILAFEGITSSLSFRNLSIVYLADVITLSINDGQLCEMAKAWPLLQELFLTFCVLPSPGTKIPTWKGFIDLIRHCPKVQTLAIVIDTTSFEEQSAWDLVQDVRNAGLAHLTLGNSPVRYPARVANIIRSLFPGLVEVDLGVWHAKGQMRTVEVRRHYPDPVAVWEQVNWYL